MPQLARLHDVGVVPAGTDLPGGPVRVEEVLAVSSEGDDMRAPSRSVIVPWVSSPCSLRSASRRADVLAVLPFAKMSG